MLLCIKFTFVTEPSINPNDALSIMLLQNSFLTKIRNNINQ